MKATSSRGTVEAHHIGQSDGYVYLRMTATMAMPEEVHAKVRRWASKNVVDLGKPNTARTMAIGLFTILAAFCDGLADSTEDDWPVIDSVPWYPGGELEQPCEGAATGPLLSFPP